MIFFFYSDVKTWDCIWFAIIRNYQNISIINTYDKRNPCHYQIKEILTKKMNWSHSCLSGYLSFSSIPCWVVFIPTSPVVMYVECAEFLYFKHSIDFHIHSMKHVPFDPITKDVKISKALCSRPLWDLVFYRYWINANFTYFTSHFLREVLIVSR